MCRAELAPRMSMSRLQIRAEENSHTQVYATSGTSLLKFFKQQDRGWWWFKKNTQANERRQLSLHRIYLVQNDMSYFEHTLHDIVQVNGKGMMTSKSLPMALLFQGPFATKFK